MIRTFITATGTGIGKTLVTSVLTRQLRAQGKTVLVISHDDRYFHLADRLVRLESGQVVDDGGARAEAA